MIEDPTLSEMIASLRELDGEDFDADCAAEAIYWFASDYHGGQWSNLYRAINECGFHPAPMARGVEPKTHAESYYAELECRFVPRRESDECQW